MSKTTVLAIGNSLMKDDGAGIHVLRCLLSGMPLGDVDLVDGGTIGFSLAPLIEDSERLIVLDAARVGAAPGSVAVKVGTELDDFIARRHATAHEVGLRDLLDMARVRGALPRYRALVGIEPALIEWGLDPSPAVERAIPHAVEAVEHLLAAWRSSPGNDGRDGRESASLGSFRVEAGDSAAVMQTDARGDHATR